MALKSRGAKKSQFQKASDGSMTLMDHLRELRSRLFKASLGLVLGLIVGVIFAQEIINFITDPYCDFMRDSLIKDGADIAGFKCKFNVVSPVDIFLLNLRVGLLVGFILSAPVWLYQLWAFVAPGLHKHERRYTYRFAAVAGPLFIGGAILGYFVISKSLQFFLGLSNQYDLTPDINGYYDFVTNVMLLFGAGFEFPLLIVALNLVGVASAKRLLSWWRVATVLIFVFCAVVTPTPDPFGMTALAIPMVGMYFAAVGFAFLHDRRKAKREAANWGGDLSDDEASDLGDIVTGEEQASEVDDPTPISPAEPPRRYDDDAT
ncbi:twin-arginine translocase subunit TatC [Actinorhabdospora filicis]|uniref:twin-arginine translocase subunit TatC n=1 Tax=Actinorhabdospora filicis TaxID=1785913 RepID=UPI002554CAA4|nr:twin-arginine translocase subunit TatC [Actinorhabdospora filicis]